MQRYSRLAVLLSLLALPLSASSPQLPVGGFGTIDSFGPQIAAGGSGYYVTWLEYDGSPQQRLYGSRLSSDGQLLDGGGILLAADDPTGSRVKFDGTHFVVALATERPTALGTQVRVLYIAPDSGTVVQEVSVPDAPGYDLALEVSAAATFLAWLDQDATLHLARIPRATGIVERAVLPVGPVAYPALSWSGSSLMVAWNTMRVIIGSPTFVVPEAVYAARVAETLTLLDTTPVLLDSIHVADAMDGSAPSAATDGQEWLVTWGDGASIRATRISSEGVRGAVEEIAHGETPLVFRRSGGYALAWKESVPATSPTRRLFVADVGSSAPLTVAVIPIIGHVSSVAGGSNREVALAWHAAFAPEYDWQASLRIVDPALVRRRSIGHR